MAKKLTQAKARKILHDKTVHGKPLTEKQRKFFGAVSSGYIKAQNGIEGTMGGLTDVGFNYNGAWGGPSMQIGGVMPGAVGFMYARTAGAAPANGPYAKKTKASAQSGKKLSYDQWKKQHNLKESPDYNLKRAWELGYTPDKTGHLPTVDNQTGQFLKAKGHPTLQLELDWYNSPEAADFRSKNAIDSSGKFFKYVPKSQNGQEMKYYQEGLDWKPRNISQDGSIISPLGQWAYPGEITTIPSNEITMQGVPYPVLGISNLGDTQMMYPGEDYTFDGEYVTEYPMMQKGGNVPIYTDNPNDPRLKAFKDSANLYNDFLRLKKMMDSKYASNKDYYVKKEDYPRNPDGTICYECIKKEAERKKAKDQFYSPVFRQGFEQLVDPNIDPRGYVNYLKDNPVFDESVAKFQDYSNARPKQPVYYKKPEQKKDKFGLTTEDYIQAKKTKWIPTPGNDKGDGYYDLKKDGKSYKVYTQSGGNSWVDVPSKPTPVKKTVPPKLQQSEPIRKIEQPKPVEIKQNMYEGSPVYYPTIGSGGPAALVGFVNQKGDTTYIKPEDYERFAVPKYGKQFIESKTKKMKNGGVSVNEADAQPLKKLDQLLNFTNYNDMAKAKKGKKLPKAQDGLSSLNTQLGSMGGIGGATGQLLDGVQMLIEEIKQKKKTQQMLALSDVSARAATSRPVGPQRKYVRPEDMLVQPGQIGSPYGTGLDFLQMEDGGPVVAQIGGNPTEIQNMYNPGDLYSDLGYEPLDESSKLKQFRKGGKARFGMQTTGTTTTAFPFSSLGPGGIGNVLGSYIGGGGGQQSGAGQIGSAVGGIAGNLLLPGVGGAIGSALGGFVGGAIGGQSQKAMEQKQRRAQGNLASAALQQSLQGQFYGYMEHGGDLKYLSHTWQPQTITKFGDYTMKELLAPPKDADMLRAGGEIRDIRSNYMGDDERLSMMQMGGELQTYWGGYAEPISQNPYLPDGGETVMFKGQSHEESDGKGRTGIGITYGDNPVEVERGEPAVKLRDGGTGDNSLVVFGNMKIPSYGVSELNDPKAKGKKFKRYAADLSKIENKANRTNDKALDILENVGGSGPFDLLSMSTANAMLKGSDMKLKDIAMKKQLAAGIQSAILDTAEEMGVESDALAKGKIKAMKGGGKLTSAQFGANQLLAPTPLQGGLVTTPEVEAMRKAQLARPSKPSSKVAKSAVKQTPQFDFSSLYKPTLQQIAAEDAQFRAENPEVQLRTVDIFQSLVGSDGPSSGRPIVPTEGQTGEKFDILQTVNMLSPYIRPLVQNRLDPSQLSPEMMALATNVPEPVQAQLFRPLLEEVPKVSLQDQLNEIQAEVNAARRMAGNNPAAQAAIAAQAAAAKNKVLGEQTRMNQMLQLESRRRNLATLNDATLKNLAILDQQFVRQEQAKSATKAQAREALSSIADKIARNKLETLQANVMSNMYPQYRFGPKGRIYNVGLTDINIPQTVGTPSPTSKNGSIVKAIKNL